VRDLHPKKASFGKRVTPAGIIMEFIALFLNAILPIVTSTLLSSNVNDVSNEHR
jgi:hypothetical protein